MKQRVALARVLVNDPDALLMDEPFAALDALTRASMQTLLLEVWSALPQTILFITHDVDEALILSERVYVMTAAPGCILEEVAVDLPRPRTLEVMATPDFLAVKRKLVTLLERARAGGRPLEIIPACQPP
jgi:NitT/TauT family transport system ATP-binding protein